MKTSSTQVETLASYDLNPYQNIIFDLGGVILNINYHLTIKEFQKYTKTNVSEFYSQQDQHEFFSLYEIGEISCSDFRSELRKVLRLDATDNQIDSAWNKMLLDLPLTRLNVLKRLSKTKRLFLFSNTNKIHKICFEKSLADVHHLESLDCLFEKAYYSHELGLRKPHKEGFELIIKENELEISRTLFIEDTLGHIQGAKKVGLETLHLTSDLDICDFELPSSTL